MYYVYCMYCIWTREMRYWYPVIMGNDRFWSPRMPRTARHPLLLSVASTSSSVPYVAAVQPHPLFLMLLQYNLISIPFAATVQPHPLFIMLLQYNIILYSLCSYSTTSSSIPYVAKVQPHPQFLMLLQYCTTSSSIPYVAKVPSNLNWFLSRRLLG